MKKILIILCIFSLIVINNVHADTNSKIEVTCDKNELEYGDTTDCYGIVSSEYKVGGVSGTISVESGLEIIKPIVWIAPFTDEIETEGEDNTFSVLLEDSIDASNTKFLKFTIKNVSEKETSANVSIKENTMTIGYSEETVETVTVGDTETTIKVKPSTESSAEKENPKTGAALSITSIILLILLCGYVYFKTKKGKRLSI